MILDPVVHAALVVVFTWLVNVLFAAMGLNLGNEVATGLANVIVGYILSLFGYALYTRVFHGARGVLPDNQYTYHPPFS